MQWEITIKELFEEGKIIYKVTRRYLDYNVSETKLFTDKNEAINQIKEWSQ